MLDPYGLFSTHYKFGPLNTVNLIFPPMVTNVSLSIFFTGLTFLDFLSALHCLALYVQGLSMLLQMSG